MELAIIGAGAWGTALAAKAAKQGEVLLWAHEPQTATAINQSQENRFFLPHQPLPANLRATNDLAELAGANHLLLAVPAQFMRGLGKQLHPLLAGEKRALVSCAKGLEVKTAALMSDVLAQELPDHDILCLSGPSFAAEVAQGLPTSLVLAAENQVAAKAVRAKLENPSLRIFPSDDLVGVQLGGAVKNVLAIACGMVEGSQLGQNAHAALIALGFAELLRLGEAAGAKRESLTGLAGLGDMVLTCHSPMSRNFSLGREVAQGQDAKKVLGARRSVSEGASGVAGLLAFAARLEINVPIARAVEAVLAGKAKPRDAMRALLAHA